MSQIAEPLPPDLKRGSRPRWTTRGAAESRSSSRCSGRSPGRRPRSGPPGGTNRSASGWGRPARDERTLHLQPISASGAAHCRPPRVLPRPQRGVPGAIARDNGRFNAFITVPREEARARLERWTRKSWQCGRARPAARHPHLAQGPDRSRRRRHDRRLARCSRATWREPTHRSPRACGRRVRLSRQVQPPRGRVRHDERGLRLRAGAQPVGSRAFGRRVERRVGGGRGRRDGLRVDWAPTRAARFAFRLRPAGASG